MQVSAETPPKLSELAHAEGFTQRFNACGSPKEALAQFSHLSVATVARALYDGSPNPLLLGAVLGHHAPYCQSLAQEYPLLFAPFRGMGVVPALRAFLWCFRLPGESAQIERVLAGFANAFFHHNQPRTAAGDAAGGSGVIDPTAVGYYVSQPAGPKGAPCCIHCGVLDGQHGQTLKSCQSCRTVHFCRRCRKLASRRGHAAAGNIGYGRGCQAALGLEQTGGTLTFTDGGGQRQTEAVGGSVWAAARSSCPAKSVDALMVLCYAIIMLTTNLHSPTVKAKMVVHEFLQQNVGINDGDNYPGDYLAAIYADIQAEELEVMPQ